MNNFTKEEKSYLEFILNLEKGMGSVPLKKSSYPPLFGPMMTYEEALDNQTKTLQVIKSILDKLHE